MSDRTEFVGPEERDEDTPLTEEEKRDLYETQLEIARDHPVAYPLGDPDQD